MEGFFQVEKDKEIWLYKIYHTPVNAIRTGASTVSEFGLNGNSKSGWSGSASEAAKKGLCVNKNLRPTLY